MNTPKSMRKQSHARLYGDRAAYDDALRMIARLVGPFVRRRIFHAAIVSEDIVQEIQISVHTKSHTHDRARPLERTDASVRVSVHRGLKRLKAQLSPQSA